MRRQSAVWMGITVVVLAALAVVLMVVLAPPQTGPTEAGDDPPQEAAGGGAEPDSPEPAPMRGDARNPFDDSYDRPAGDGGPDPADNGGPTPADGDGPEGRAETSRATVGLRVVDEASGAPVAGARIGRLPGRPGSPQAVLYDVMVAEDPTSVGLEWVGETDATGAFTTDEPRGESGDGWWWIAEKVELGAIGAGLAVAGGAPTIPSPGGGGRVVEGMASGVIVIGPRIAVTTTVVGPDGKPARAQVMLAAASAGGSAAGAQAGSLRTAADLAAGAWSGRNRMLGQTETNADGVAGLAVAAPDGALAVFAQPLGDDGNVNNLPNAVRVDAPARHTRVTIALRAGRSLGGRVVDQDGNGVPFAKVAVGLSDVNRVEDDDRFGPDESTFHAVGTRADADGNFVLTGLPTAADLGANDWLLEQVAVVRRGYEPFLKALDGETTLSVTLNRLGWQPLILTAPTGKLLTITDATGLSVTLNAKGIAAISWSGAPAPIEAVWMRNGVPIDADGGRDPVAQRPGGGYYVSGRMPWNAGRTAQGIVARAQTAQEWAGGRPAPGTRDRLDDAPRSVADAEVHFRVVGMAPGEYSVSVSHSRFGSIPPVDVSITGDGAEEPLRLAFSPGVALSGIVVDGGGSPVPGATVHASDMSREVPPELLKRGMNDPQVFRLMSRPYTWDRRAVTDEAGRFSFDSLPQGRVTLVTVPQSANPDGLTPAETVVTATTDAPPVRVTLTQGPALRAVVRVAEGGAVPEFRASIAPVDPGFSIRGDTMEEQLKGLRANAVERTIAEWTSQAAAVQIDGADITVRGLVPDTTYTISVFAAGFLDAEATATPGDTPVTITLSSGGTIRGRVALAEGGSPASITIRLRPEARPLVMTMNAGRSFSSGDPNLSYDAQTGLFTLTGIEPGTYSVIGTAPGRAEARVDGVEVGGEGPTQPLVLTLPTGYRLEVVVTDPQGQPVSGARVAAGDPDTPDIPFVSGLEEEEDGGAATDVNGRVVFEQLTRSRVKIIVRADGYATRRVVVDVADRPRLEIGLMDAGRLIVEVYDADGKPQVGTQVMLMLTSGGGRFVNALETDKDGRAIFSGLTPGNYMVQATDPDFENQRTGTVTVGAGETATLRLAPETGGVTVTGTVTRGGKPATEGRLAFMAARTAKQTPAELESNGRFEVELQPGRYTVFLQSSMMSFSRTSVTIPDEPGPIDIVIDFAAGKIAGTLLDADGAPVAQMLLYAYPATDGEDAAVDEFERIMPLGQALTDGDGKFEIGGLPTGRVVIQSVSGFSPGAAASPGGVRETVNVTGGTTTVTLKLRRGGTLVVELEGFKPDAFEGGRLEVRDPDGRDLAGLAAMMTGGRLSATSRYPDLLPGPYTVVVHVPGYARTARRASIVTGETTTLRISAPPGITLTLAVVGADGRPAVDAQVRVIDAAGRTITPLNDFFAALSGGGLRTDAAGRATIRDLPSGPLTIEVVPADADAGERFRITIPAGAETYEESVRLSGD
jgi:hypothetical protein